MRGLLLLLFVFVPAVEIVTLMEVGQRIGGLATFGLILATGVAGAWLAKSQGLAVLSKMRDMGEVESMARSVLEGVFILVAGALMMTPGFWTDGLGLALLLPPTRRWLAELAARRFQFQLVSVPGADPAPPGVIDV